MRILSPTQIHYAVSCALLILYGTQVCPFVNTLSLFEIVAPIILMFMGLYGLRRILQLKLEQLEIPKQVNAQFKADLTLLIAGGFLLAIYNYVVNDFPPASGLKIGFGMLALGIFIACDLGLRREHYLVSELGKSGKDIITDQAPYSLTKKFAWFATICIVIFGAVVSLIVIKDLTWLSTIDDVKDLKKAALAVSIEIGFVVLVILSYNLVVISSYGANLKLFFDFQSSTLNQVANGQLTAHVPVASNDEFGIIAKNTNLTIEALRTRTQELDQMRDATILGLSSLAETRDNETGEHILRTQQYVRVLAEHLQNHPRFKSVLTPSMIELIYKSSPLHDSGKVGIPDAILLKPGRLTDEEFETMKQHSLIGSEALKSAQEVLGSNSFLTVACEIMETHHEKWDGSGYPYGLKGEEIPVSGRLMALADVYDALISERIYKEAFSHEKARGIIVEGKGVHFDPDVVNAFLELETVFQEIAQNFSRAKTPIRTAA